MSAPDDRSNPLGHLRFNTPDYSAISRQMEEMQNVGRMFTEQFASYRPPQIDFAELNRMTKTVEELTRGAQGHIQQFTDMLGESQKGWQEAQKTIQAVLKSSDFQHTLEHAHRMTQSVSNALFQLPHLMDGFSVIQDHIIVKDLILQESFMPPAGECRGYGSILPFEEIIRQNITLDSVTFTSTSMREAVAGRSATEERITASAEEKTTEEKSSAPLFIQHINLSDGREIFEHLPEGAELIDEMIALYEPFKAGLFICVQTGYWIKEEDEVTPQSIKIIQYLRRIGKRPGHPWANATELAKHLAPRAQCIATGRRSIANRMSRLQQICKDHNTKPLFMKVKGLWRINPDLTYWDRVGYMPQYYGGGH